jgi:hypothetical protein
VVRKRVKVQAGGVRYSRASAVDRGSLQALLAFCRERQALLMAAAATLLPLAVYIATAAPTLYTIDSPELSVAAWTLGVAHAPGYPLYTLAGWLFSHAVQVGDPAYRLNILSGVFGAAGVLLVYLLAFRLAGNRIAALGAALTLAFSYWYWRESLYAEVYTLDAMLIAGALLLAFTWRENGDARALLGAGLLVGLALANRTSSLALIPVIGLLVAHAQLSGRQQAHPLALAGAAAALLPGLALYAYIPLNAGAQYVWSDFWSDGTRHDLRTLDGFWWIVSAQSFEHYAFAVGQGEFIGNLARQAGWLASGFVGFGAAVGAYGAWRQWRSDPTAFAALALLAASYAVFFAAYDVADREFMVLPVYVVFALWLALGLAALPQVAGRLLDDDRLGERAAVAAALALPLVAFAVTLPAANLSGHRDVRESSELLFSRAEPNAVVIGTWVEVAPLLYLQQVDDMRPDVRLQFTASRDPRQVQALVAQQRGAPVYVGALQDMFGSPYRLEPVGPWYRVELGAGNTDRVPGSGTPGTPSQ